MVPVDFLKHFFKFQKKCCKTFEGKSGAKAQHWRMVTRQRSGAKGLHNIAHDRDLVLRDHTTLEMATRHLVLRDPTQHWRMVTRQRSGAKGAHTTLENGHTTEIWC